MSSRSSSTGSGSPGRPAASTLTSMVKSAWTEPSKTMGPSVTITETKEGEIIAARNALVTNANHLGPPDLCYTVRLTSTGIMRSPTMLRQGHFVHGQETSSPAAIAAYFVNLNKIWPDLHHGTYCCYNAFSKCDMRVEFQLPGSIQCFSMPRDGSSRKDTVTVHEWQEVEVSSMLRCISMLKNNRKSFLPVDEKRSEIGSNCAVVLNDPLTLAMREASFLVAAESVFGVGHLLGAPPSCTPSNCLNYMTLTIFDHFVSSGRPLQAEIFFSKFRPSHPDVAILIARATQCNPSGDVKRALALLAASLPHVSESMAQLMLIEQSKLVMRAGDVTTAIFLAEAAITKSTINSALAICYLSELYLSSERPAMALATLNQLDNCRALGQGKQKTKAANVQNVLIPSLRLKRSGSASQSGRIRKSSIPESLTKETLRAEQSLLTSAPVDNEDEPAFKLLARMGKVLGLSKVVSLRNQLFSDSTKPIEEAQIQIYPRACTQWLNRLFVKFYVDSIMVEYWYKVLCDGTKLSSRVCSAAASIAIRLQHDDQAQKFIESFRHDKKYCFAADLILLEISLRKKNDIKASLTLLNDLAQKITGPAYIKVAHRHYLLESATQIVLIWGHVAAVQALIDNNFEGKPGEAIVTQAINILHPYIG